MAKKDEHQHHISVPHVLIGVLLLAAVVAVGGLAFDKGGVNNASDTASNGGGPAIAVLQPDGTSEAGNSSSNTPESTPVETDASANVGLAQLPLESITLGVVNGFVGSGVATRTVDQSGIYSHTLTLDIDDPVEGKFYEGWIVGPSVISTGKLAKDGDKYTLSYSSPEDLIDWVEVVVTEETEADGLDGSPELHIFEGSF